MATIEARTTDVTRRCNRRLRGMVAVRRDGNPELPRHQFQTTFSALANRSAMKFIAVASQLILSMSVTSLRLESRKKAVSLAMAYPTLRSSVVRSELRSVLQFDRGPLPFFLLDANSLNKLARGAAATAPVQAG